MNTANGYDVWTSYMMHTVDTPLCIMPVFRSDLVMTKDKLWLETNLGALVRGNNYCKNLIRACKGPNEILFYSFANGYHIFHCLNIPQNPSNLQTI